MKRGLVLLLLLWASPCAVMAADKAVFSVAPEPADKPWWRRAVWQPRATSVHNVPIKRLHPDWCAAEALGRERLDEAVGAASVDQALEGRSFTLEGNFDGGGTSQLTFVGAYRRCSGEQGLFVAIVEPSRERARMRFLVEVPDPGSALAMLGREPDGTLAVWWCADCANGNRIAYSRDKREFFVAASGVCTAPPSPLLEGTPVRSTTPSCLPPRGRLQLESQSPRASSLSKRPANPS
jgi:hypothetical protein